VPRASFSAARGLCFAVDAFMRVERWSRSGRDSSISLVIPTSRIVSEIAIGFGAVREVASRTSRRAHGVSATLGALKPRLGARCAWSNGRVGWPLELEVVAGRGGREGVNRMLGTSFVRAADTALSGA